MASEEVKDVLMDAGSPEVEGEVEEEESGEDSSESDDSEPEDDKSSLEVLEQLQAAVNATPGSYEAHIQYIAALRKAGMLEKLRAGRESMNSRFPLLPTLWLQWTSDEARIASGSEDIMGVEALFERGVQEYLSVPLWVEYLNFVEDQDVNVAQCSEEGLSKMRQLCERALSAAGLHVTEGAKIWEVYRDFEQAVLLALGDSTLEAKTKQVDRVRTLFHRQLKVPLANYAETLEEYKSWEEHQGNHFGSDADEFAGMPSNIILSYKKASQLYTSRQPFEERVADSKPVDAELLKHYMDYAAAEEAAQEPARVQVVYERALSVFPVTAELWEKYTQYLETNLKVPAVILGVYARAVRNCPWTGKIWISYLLAMERYSSPETEIAAVFEQALQSGIESQLVYLDLFLTRADGIRRRIVSTSPNTTDLVLLREAFGRAVLYLSLYPELFEYMLQLHAYWADVEARVNRDLPAARGVWETLVKSSGRYFQVWQGYIGMEVALNNISEARAIYKRCYSRRFESQGTELLCDAWLRFEREHGSLEDYDIALQKVGPRVTEVHAMVSQQEAKAVALHQRVKDNHRKSAAVKHKGKSVNGATDGKSKNKRGLGFKDPVSKKRPKVLKDGAAEPVWSDNDAVKPPEAPKPEDAVQDGHQGEAGDKDMLDVDTGAAVAPVQGKGKETRTKKDVASDLAASIEECTVFVKNLNFEADKLGLKEFFGSDDGGVKDVRLVKERLTGKFKGFAYVEFESDDYVASAVAKDGKEFMGRKISVARSKPTVATRGGRGGRRGGGWRGRGAPDFISHRRGGHVDFKGSTTFALPRAVARPLGWNAGEARPKDDSEPKTNQDFRNLLNRS